jgi:hypothetical protein
MKRLKVNLTNELGLGTCSMHWRIGVHTSPSYKPYTRSGERKEMGPGQENFRYSQRREIKLSVLFFHLKRDIRRGLDPFDRFPSSILSPNYSHIAKKPTREYYIL